MEDYWPYITIIILVACSAFFSASEIAYASLNKLRLKNAAEEGGLRAIWAGRIVDQYERSLCTILMGNNLVNIGASSVGTVIAMELVGGEQGAAYATAIMTVIILIFGEIVPKQVAKQHADSFSLMVAPLIRLLTVITQPLVTVVMFLVNSISRLWGSKGEAQGITADELVTIIETVEDEGVIDEERSDLLQSAIEFSEVEVQEIITHRVDMLVIDIDDSLDEILQTVMESSYSRIPVYEDNIDNIIGVLVVNQFYRKLLETKDFNLRSLLTPVCYVHESLTLPVVFEELQRQKMQLAVVIDEYGGTQGIVTMEDILEQLVGEIWDESDEVYDEFVELGENLYECSGNLGVDDFFDHLDLDPPMEEDDDYMSMGGWAIEMLDGFPNEGDHFQYKNLFVTVTEMKEQRVVKLQIEVDPLLEAQEQAGDRLRNQH